MGEGCQSPKKTLSSDRYIILSEAGHNLGLHQRLLSTYYVPCVEGLQQWARQSWPLCGCRALALGPSKNSQEGRATYQGMHCPCLALAWPYYLKFIRVGTSLVVQWLGLRASTAWGTGFDPWSDPSMPHGVARKKMIKFIRLSHGNPALKHL